MHLHAAGHGERAGDAVRAVVRGEAVPHAGHLPAAVVDHPVGVRRGAAPRVPVHGAAAGGAGAGPGHLGGGGDRGALVHPRALLLRLGLPAADVPAGADQEHDHHVPRHAQPRPPPRPVLARRRPPPPRPRRRHGLHGRRHVDPRVRPARLRLLRRMPSHLDRILVRRLRRPRRHRQALALFWCHALVSKASHCGLWVWMVSIRIVVFFSFSLELWYNTILVLLTGYMKNAEIALDALSIW
nr:unknown [Zea mays]